MDTSYLKESLKNINFWLRLIECVVSLIGVFFKGNPNEWLLYGWLFTSLALLWAYMYEQPQFGQEVIVIVLHLIPMSYALWHFSIDSILPAFVAVLMFIDLVFLVMNRNV